jgi:hypothetical protein
MGNRRKRGHKIQGHFIALPSELHKSFAFRKVSNTAKLIYYTLAMGYNGRNNGELALSFETARDVYGLSASKQTFYRALNELIEMDLVFRIVKGAKGTASRYALTSWKIDDVDSLTHQATFKPTFQPLKKYEKHDPDKNSRGIRNETNHTKVVSEMRPISESNAISLTTDTTFEGFAG